jgi:hypothetical protein
LQCVVEFETWLLISPYAIEQRLVTVAWLHERPYTGDTMATVKAKFCDRFGVELRRKTILAWETVLLQEAV